MVVAERERPAIPEVFDLPELAPVRLSRQDAEKMAKGLSEDEVRWLCDTYYQLQDFRTASANQVRAATVAAEPSSALKWTYEQMATTEASLRRIMDQWTDLSAPGRWAKSIVGIGPVLAANLLATFDAEKPTVGHWWRFAGLDPTLKWEKGQKRPFSAKAKLLCWKIGDSFVKVSGKPNAYYGQLYKSRKQFELDKDAAGDHDFQAKMTLLEKNIREKKTKETYEAGNLPAGRLDLRARRYAVKLFLSHLHWVMWESRTGNPPPKPYVIEHLGHANLMSPPNWPVE